MANTFRIVQDWYCVRRLSHLSIDDAFDAELQDWTADAWPVVADIQAACERILDCICVPATVVQRFQPYMIDELELCVEKLAPNTPSKAVLGHCLYRCVNHVIDAYRSAATTALAEVD